MKDKLIVAGVVVALLLGGFSFFSGGGADGRDGANGRDGTFAAFPGPELDSPFLSVNGLRTHYYSSGLSQTSTTVCSFRTPAATSTLVHASLQIRTGTTTDLFWEIGKATTGTATTTSLGVFTNAGIEMTMLASTTVISDLANSRTVFAPRDFLNFKYGTVGSESGSTNVLVGSCRAEFIES